MLSNEEKKVIEILRKVKDEKPFVFWFAGECYNKTAIFDILLNLIEKQFKEIEELKQEKEYLNCIIESDKDNYINKDKIKAKIEEFKIVRDTILENEKELNRPMMTYDLKRNDYCEKMLQSLLEKE